ncbi:MAG TPA: sigma-70 family RNA polymerase sigma factor [Polyangiaceae bacterium]|nr:sigma-70 family RNA polymerase sigma factor [Polyangiaceae bacterium]
MTRASQAPSDPVRDVTDEDRRQLSDLYRVHHKIIWRTLRRMGFNPESAADFTQQAYLIALERLAYIFPGSEKAFLFSTAIFFGRTALRKERRLELSEEVDLGSDLGASAAQLTNRQFALQVLDRVLGSMAPDLITVFSLYEIEGMTAPEISELLGIPVGTVASRLRRARDAFRSKTQHLDQALKSSAAADPHHSLTSSQIVTLEKQP